MTKSRSALVWDLPWKHAHVTVLHFVDRNVSAARLARYEGVFWSSDHPEISRFIRYARNLRRRLAAEALR